MIKILDKYLTKQFLQMIGFGILAFAVIFVIIDMMENLDDFIDQNVPNHLILQYYVVFIPEIIRLMLPVAVLLACLFTVGKMSGLNEITAIKAGGISLYRFMLPFLVTAFLISLFSVYFGGYIVPMANKHKVFIEQTYMKKGVVRPGSNILFQDTNSRLVSIGRFDATADQAYQISIQQFDKNDLTKMVSRVDAIRMKYDSTKNDWILFNGIKREFEGVKENTSPFTSLAINYLNFKPVDIMQKQRKPEEMTLTELSDYAKEQLRAGNDPTRIKIEYHSRIAFAFASFIVVLFGLPISTDKRKSGVALQIGINLLITFIYLVFMQVSQAFGKNGVLSPILTAWFANLVFLAAALFNLRRASK